MKTLFDDASKLIRKNAPDSGGNRKTVLWWGRFDPGYSRNRLVWGLFDSLGWKNVPFRPLSSDLGYFESIIRMLQKPDLIWVPCFRHRDAVSACIMARKWNIPVVFDPLISAYEKEVFEKKKWPVAHKRSVKLKKWEKRLFAMADLVVADTHAHADFFHSSFGTDKRKIKVLFVGAEEDSFKGILNEKAEEPERKIEVLFYGSFLQLHGVDIIADAAMKTRDLDIRWVLLGDGPCKESLKSAASGNPSFSFEDPVPYSRLPERISRADILLGVFGSTIKAGLVIPNKIFQAMAMAKPVITMAASSYPEEVSASDVIGWVRPGSSEELSEKVREWVNDPSSLKERGKRTRALYERFFSRDILKTQLSGIIDTAFANMRKGIR